MNELKCFQERAELAKVAVQAAFDAHARRSDNWPALEQEAIRRLDEFIAAGGPTREQDFPIR